MPTSKWGICLFLNSPLGFPFKFILSYKIFAGRRYLHRPILLDIHPYVNLQKLVPIQKDKWTCNGIKKHPFQKYDPKHGKVYNILHDILSTYIYIYIVTSLIEPSVTERHTEVHPITLQFSWSLWGIHLQKATNPCT